MPRTRLILSLTLGTTLLLGGLPAARGEWAIQVEPVPIERLIDNLTARAKRMKDDAPTHFALARVHSLAFAARTTQVEWKANPKPGELPEPFPWDSVQNWPNERFDKDRITHYHQSIHHYEQAVRYDPEHARAWLGMGYLLVRGAPHALVIGRPNGAELKAAYGPGEREQHAAWLADLGSEDAEVARKARDELRKALPKSSVMLIQGRRDGSKRQADAIAALLAHWYRTDARRALRKVVELKLTSDVKEEYVYVGGDGLLSEEASKLLLELARLEPESEERDRRIEELETRIAKLGAVGRFETPIVFPLDLGDELRDLLPPGRTASFDLSGDDRANTWPWVSPRTGVLVWDPAGTGEIRSGRQLFGGRTWFLGWSDGYAALDALDDDADGELAGEELTGIRVWVDADGDAVSDPGEVADLRHHGIVGISTRPDRRTPTPELDEHAPAIAESSQGLQMADGAWVPTFDWTPRRPARARP